MEASKGDHWVCPNDRELSLLSRLNTGWTSNKSLDSPNFLSAKENDHIKRVIKKAEQVDICEQHRIGRLVDKYETIKDRAVGDGEANCLLCGEKFSYRPMRPTQKTCQDCVRAVCYKCSVEVNAKMTLCKICSENRELWKKSGAWFIGGMPKYIPLIKTSNNTSSNNSTDLGSRVNTRSQQVKPQLDQYRTWRQAKCCPSSPSSDESDDDLDVRGGQVSETNISPVNSATESGREDQAMSEQGGRTPDDMEIQGAINNYDEVEAMNTAPNCIQAESSSELGTLNFSVLYDSHNRELVIYLENALDLPAMDASGSSDPYCKVYLLPAQSSAYKKRTKTVRQSLNPTWEEKVSFYGINEQDMAYRTLRVCVLDEDPIGYDFIGEYRLILNTVPQNKTIQYHVGLERSAPITDKDDMFEHERGRIHLSLRYDPSRQRLTVGVLRCSFLLPMDTNGKSDPYVKMYLRPDKDKKTKVKTKVKKKTLDPVFNEEFHFTLRPDEISKKALEVTVWDKDTGSRDDYIGCIVLGKCARGERLRHWFSTFKQTGKVHRAWHQLSGEAPEKLLSAM